MSAIVFVDTNVLVYARDLTEPERNLRALEWMATLWQTRSGRLSYQVLQEYYVTVTRKLDPPRDVSDARGDVASLISWRPIPIELPVIDHAWAIQDRYGFSWWDSLIIGAASQAGCTHVLTEDLQHRQDVEAMIVINPFRTEPATVLPV
jgi:predicted nucleic acid-binding protein